MQSSRLAIFIFTVLISLSAQAESFVSCFLTLTSSERLKLIDEALNWNNWRGGPPDYAFYRLGYILISEDPSGRTVTFSNPETGAKIEIPTREGGQISINIIGGDDTVLLRNALETGGNFRHRFFDHALAEGRGEFRFTEHSFREAEYFLNEKALKAAGFVITYEQFYKDTSRVVRFTRFQDGAMIDLVLWNRVGMFDYGIEDRRNFERVAQSGGRYISQYFRETKDRPVISLYLQPRPGPIVTDEPQPPQVYPFLKLTDDPKLLPNETAPKIILHEPKVNSKQKSLFQVATDFLSAGKTSQQVTFL